MLGGHGGLAAGARARARAERAEEPAVPARPARLGCQAAVPRCLAQGQLLTYLPHNSSSSILEFKQVLRCLTKRLYDQRQN